MSIRMNNCTVKETEINNILYTIQSYPFSKGFANTNNNLKMYRRIMLQEHTCMIKGLRPQKETTGNLSCGGVIHAFCLKKRSTLYRVKNAFLLQITSLQHII